MPSINQQRIADQLGISRTTVSRCFTNHRGINPVTRAKVFDLASQLGYQHMEMRAPTRPKRQKIQRTVAALICTELEEYFRSDYQSPGTELYAGISEYAQVHDIRLSLHYVSPKDQELNAPSYRSIDLLWNRGADGIVLIYPFPRKVVDEIHMLFPMVSLVEQYGTASFNCVDADHYKGIASLLNRLVAQGHRRIGFYTKNLRGRGAMVVAALQRVRRKDGPPGPAGIGGGYYQRVSPPSHDFGGKLPLCPRAHPAGCHRLDLRR